MTLEGTSAHDCDSKWSLVTLCILCVACGSPRKTTSDTSRVAVVSASNWRVDTLANAPARFRPDGWSSEEVLWGLVRGRVTRFDSRTGVARTLPSTGWALQTAPD